MKTKTAGLKILALLCVLLVGYIIYDVIDDYYANKVDEAFDAGAEATLLKVYNGTKNCSTLEINYKNESKVVIDLNCAQLFYNQGITNAINTIMARAQNCSVVPLYSGNYTLNLVDVNCTKI